jgi:hypothetical protein
VGYAMDKVALGQVFDRVLRLYRVSIIPLGFIHMKLSGDEKLEAV